jgi:hypothetical protein
VTGDNVAVAIDQNRDIETESLDTGGNSPDLLFAVAPRVSGVGFELFDRRSRIFKSKLGCEPYS